MNKKTIIGIVAVIVVVVAVVALSNGEKDNGPIRIGAPFMLTGPTAHLGELQKNGVTLAVEKINENGGINGRPIEVVMEDAGYDPRLALNAYYSLKNKGIKNFIIDGSSVVASTRPVVVADGNFTISAVATAPSYFDNNNHSCRIALTSKNIGPALSDLALSKNYKNVSLFLPDNEYGRGLAEEFTKAFTEKGGKIVAKEFYEATPGANDFKTSITKIKANQGATDAVVFSQILNNIEPMLKQMKTLGLNKPILSEFPTVTNPALKDVSLMEGVEFIDGEYVKGESSTDSSETKEFKKKYKERFGTEPIYFAAGHYDAIILIAKAVREVGEDPNKIANYISSLKNYTGITGTFSFDSDCEIQRKTVVRKLLGGKIVDLK